MALSYTQRERVGGVRSSVFGTSGAGLSVEPQGAVRVTSAAQTAQGNSQRHSHALERAGWALSRALKLPRIVLVSL